MLRLSSSWNKVRKNVTLSYIASAQGIDIYVLLQNSEYVIIEKSSNLHLTQVTQHTERFLTSWAMQLEHLAAICPAADSRQIPESYL